VEGLERAAAGLRREVEGGRLTSEGSEAAVEKERFVVVGGVVVLAVGVTSVTEVSNVASTVVGCVIFRSFLKLAQIQISLMLQKFLESGNER
jgi:hypothetical protein